MKYGALVIVNNCESTIKDYLNYYLKVQMIDNICVIDNGSQDKTVSVIKALQDHRIILTPRSLQHCHTVAALAKIKIKELFYKYHCRGVVLLAQDRYVVCDMQDGLVSLQSFFAETGQPTHSLSGRIPVLRFIETEYDNHNENNYLIRMCHCKASGSDSLHFIADPEDIKSLIFNRDELDPEMEISKSNQLITNSSLRYHTYPMLNINDGIAKTLCQAERHIISSEGDWLYNSTSNACPVFERYMLIKNDEFESYYRSQYFYSQMHADRSLADGSLLRNDDMRLVFDSSKAVL